jgi:hypothetical protein
MQQFVTNFYFLQLHTKKYANDRLCTKLVAIHFNYFGVVPTKVIQHGLSSISNSFDYI